jgi:hypothetical protein
MSPSADFAAVGRVHKLLRPAGRLLLAVPVGRDAVVWNMQVVPQPEHN